MKKVLIFILFTCSVLLINAQELVQTTIEKKTDNSFCLLPRYFNDNIIVTNNTMLEKTCELYIFSSSSGKNVMSQLLNIHENNYKISTIKLKKGEYVYFIVENNIPIIRGTFIKS